MSKYKKEIMRFNTNFFREINWDGYTATLRTARKEHACAACSEPIVSGEKAYVVVTWNGGLAGKKFPKYVHPEHLEQYWKKLDR